MVACAALLFDTQLPARVRKPLQRAAQQHSSTAAPLWQIVRHVHGSFRVPHVEARLPGGVRGPPRLVHIADRQRLGSDTKAPLQSMIEC
jgi:hypothetical protein